MRIDLAQQVWPARPAGQDFALMLVVYGALAALAQLLARQPGAIAAVWLANGAATALIVSAPRTRAPALMVAVALSSIVTDLAFGDPPVLALVFTLPNVLETALGAWLIRRSGGAEQFATDHRVLIRVLLLAALVAPAAGGALASVLLQAFGKGDLHELWLHWAIGSALGSVAALPLLLSWRAQRRADWRGRLRPAGSHLLAMLAAPLAAALILRTMYAPYGAIGLLLVAGAFLLPRSATFLNVFSAVCTLALAIGQGWYRPGVEPTPAGQLQVHLAMLLVVLPAQVVAVVAARQRAFATMLSAVGSRAEDILVFTDMSGTYRWVNQAHEDYCGVPRAQAVGRTWAENLPPEVHRTGMQAMIELALAGQVAHGVLDLEFPGRGRRSVDFVVQPARDEDDHQVGVLLRGTDVTGLEASRRELRSLTERLGASNESLEQFVRIASHDLREPLNTIEQFCGLIEDDRLSDESRVYFGHVRGGATRMKALLDDVLRFVHLEAGPEGPVEPASVDEAAAAALAALRSRIDAAQAQVQVVAPLGQVRVDAGMLLLALQNLVSNAVKFTPPGRRSQVRISAADEGPMKRLTVQDNGIGIDPARIGELGRPFRRLHSRRSFDGTGLGLAICKRIAEQHGGRLEIESQPDRGSRFHLVLPAAAHPGPVAGA